MQKGFRYERTLKLVDRQMALAERAQTMFGMSAQLFKHKADLAKRLVTEAHVLEEKSRTEYWKYVMLAEWKKQDAEKAVQEMNAEAVRLQKMMALVERMDDRMDIMMAKAEALCSC
jgi:hypothetical protein